MKRFSILVVSIVVAIIVILVIVAMDSPKPKFKIGQVVAVAQGPYFRIGYIDRSVDNTGHVYFRYSDATEKNPAAGFWPEEELRSLSSKECGR